MPMDVEQRDVKGWCALHHAADCGDEDACTTLLHQGADPDLQSGELMRSSVGSSFIRRYILLPYGMLLRAHSRSSKVGPTSRLGGLTGERR